MKFISWGMKNNIKVLEKCPNIPATANVIPEKYVKLSPTNTLDGYQL